MKTILFTLTLLVSFVSFSQVTFISEPKPEINKVMIYDSLYDVDIIVNGLSSEDESVIGQKLLLLPEHYNKSYISKEISDYFYKPGFVYTDKDKFYENSFIKYDTTQIKLFTILGYAGEYNSDFILVDDQTKDTVYSKTKIYPFICVGYYEKQKNIYNGGKYVFNEDLSEKLPNNYDNGSEVNKTAGQTWECVSVSVLNGDVVLLLKNNINERVMVDNSFISSNDSDLWTLKEANTFKNKYGVTIWNKILQGTVSIGMTKEMVTQSWGKPYSVNRSSYSEQWVYNYKYLYFTNGKLTDFN